MNLPRRLKAAQVKEIAIAVAISAAALGATYAAIKDPTGTGLACNLTPMGQGACALKRYVEQSAKPAP